LAGQERKEGKIHAANDRAMNESRSQAETIFVAARQLAGARERATYLDKECGEDRVLRENVERMLIAEEKADQFFANNPLEFSTSPLASLDPVPGEGAPIGSYKLLQRIGEGGCGIVYMAEQEQPIRRRVALKVIKPGMDTRQVIARFEAERQALAMMDHPNIAKVLDAGATEAGRPYFVMELVRGIKVTDYCDQNHLAARERLDLFVKVVQAVQHAHQKGIIHRDLKPSNVLVTLHDGVPVPKVIDFGIAKAVEQKLTEKTLFTQFEQFIGTPAYTSPEQAEMSGLDVDTRSDIYSLGVLLYELLAGSTPFDAKELLRSGLGEMRRIIREQEPERPSTRFSTMLATERTDTARRRAASPPELIHLLKGDLDWIVMKCLEKDRTRRYETANGLAADIQHYLSNEPVIARPPSTSYRLGKLVRRNKLAFAAGASVVIALLIGILASLWQATRARRAELAAKAEKESAEAVLDFFRDKVLAVGRPKGVEGGLGREVTLRQAIDSAEAQIADAFNHRPLVEAAVRHALGETYFYLGEMSLAIQQLERARALGRQESGLNNPRTSKSATILATAYLWAGLGDQAAQLEKQILAETPANPTANAEDLTIRAEILARQGRWTQAEAGFSAALRLNPKDHNLYHYLTACLVQTRDLEAYRRHCQQIMARFKDTTDVAVADRMAKDCAILFPESGVDLAMLDRMTDVAMATSESSYPFPWYLYGKGLVQYRQGRYAAAAESMQKVLMFSHRGRFPERNVGASMVLAMARYHLDGYAQAESALVRGLKLAEAELPKLENESLGISWVDWVFAHALMLEARSLIKPSTP